MARREKKFFSKKNKFWYMKHHFQFARQILKTNDQLIFGSKSMKARHNTNSWKISLWHKKKFLSKILTSRRYEHLHYLNFEMIIVWSEKGIASGFKNCLYYFTILLDFSYLFRVRFIYKIWNEFFESYFIKVYGM